MSLIVLALAALLAQADAGVAPTASQLERRHLEAVQEIARLRSKMANAKYRPALERQIAALTAEVDALPGQIAAAKAAEGQRRATELAGATAAADQRAEALAADPAYAVPALSAAVCNARGLRADAKETIRREQADARRGGGVVDLTLLHDAQGLVREADERERAVRAALRRFKRQPQPCRGKILLIATCAEDKHAEGCTEVRDYLAAYDAL